MNANYVMYTKHMPYLHLKTMITITLSLAQNNQATIGKNTTPKPGMMNMVGKVKWTAWADLGDMSQVGLLTSKHFL